MAEGVIIMPVIRKILEKTVVAVQTKTEVAHSKTGSVVVKEEVQGMVGVPPAYANVGVTAQRTINLGGYNSVKLGLSIHHPCAPDPEAIEACYGFCIGWVDEHMASLTKDHDTPAEDA